MQRRKKDGLVNTMTRPMLARDIMQPNLITVAMGSPLEEVAALLSSRMISGAPVVDADENLVGVIAATDIMAHVADVVAATSGRQPDKGEYYTDLWFKHNLHHGFTDEVPGDDEIPGDEYEGMGMCAADVMTPVVHAVDDDETIETVVDLMTRLKIHRVIVTRKIRVVGIITTMDLIRIIPGLLKSEQQ